MQDRTSPSGRAGSRLGWGASVNASHIDGYQIGFTNGSAPNNPIGWSDSTGPWGATDDANNARLYWTMGDLGKSSPHNLGQQNMSPSDWSIRISAPTHTAFLYNGPNLTGSQIGSVTLDKNAAWHLRFMQADGSSAGFPGTDNALNLYSYASASTYTWHSYGGHLYALTQNYSTWADAEAEAVAAGGHLVTINDAGENAFLTNLISDSYGRGMQGNGWQNMAWIGYCKTNGTWGWVDGESVSYTNPYASGLMPTEPQGGIDQAYLHGPSQPVAPGTWYNYYINNTTAYQPLGIIEVTPEPATLSLLALGSVAVLRRKRK